MQYVGRIFSNLKGFYGGINAATLTGATDVLVVQQPDGSLVSSSFHVRFGKLGVLRASAKEVDVEVNGKPVDVRMLLDESGQAYFPVEPDIEDDNNEQRLSDALLDSSSSVSRRRCISESVMRSASLERRRQVSSPTEMTQKRCKSEGDPEHTNSDTLSTSPKSGDVVVQISSPESDESASHMSRAAGFDRSAEPGDKVDGAFKRLVHVATAPTIPSPERDDNELTPTNVQELNSTVEFTLENETSTEATQHRPISDAVNITSELGGDAADREVAMLGASEVLLGTSPPDGILCASPPNLISPASPIPGDPYTIPDVHISMCGIKNASAETFDAKKLSYQEFCSDLALISHPDLVISINGKYYTWEVAGPIILSMLAFQKNLPKSKIRSLEREGMKKQERRSMISWLRWGQHELDYDAGSSDDEELQLAFPQGVQLANIGGTVLSEDSGAELGEGGADDTTGDNPSTAADVYKLNSKRAFRLTTEQLQKLGLREGVNCVTYSVTTSYQGTKRCRANIYLWHYSDKIVVSDIDGTITKSDVLGQLLPLMGKDWSQGGVVELYTGIVQNGYKVLYLSARAIGQAEYTKGYLNWVEQQQLKLPQGPLLLTPESLLVAFKQEVIRKQPEVFKTELLEEVTRLFPSSSRPLFAGFGNKINDEKAYSAVGIPRSRIFYVNHRGQLNVACRANITATYNELQELIDHYFPPLTRDRDHVRSLADPLLYSTFSFWRQPVPEISLDLVTVDKTSTNKSKEKSKRKE